MAFDELNDELGGGLVAVAALPCSARCTPLGMPSWPLFHSHIQPAYTPRMQDRFTHTTDVRVADPAVNQVNPASPDLTVLLRRIAQQDEAALAAFYDATAARCYAVARRFTQDAWLAEDVVADVYLQVWQQAGRYDASRATALAWLLMLCRSRALDAMRRRDPAEPMAEPETLHAAQVASAESPLESLESLDRRARVHAALATLAPNERQLLALAFFRGLTHQEIAQQTGLPLGTAKTLLRKAQQQLKQQLACLAPTPPAGESHDAG